MIYPSLKSPHQRRNTYHSGAQESEDSLTGPERTLMVAATLTKRLRNERRLFASELRALERESQTVSVLQRKDVLSKKVPELEGELIELEKTLKKILLSPSDQLNPSGKYYVMAEKLVGSQLPAPPLTTEDDLPEGVKVRGWDYQTTTAQE